MRATCLICCKLKFVNTPRQVDLSGTREIVSLTRVRTDELQTERYTFLIHTNVNTIMCVDKCSSRY